MCVLIFLSFLSTGTDKEFSPSHNVQLEALCFKIFAGDLHVTTPTHAEVIVFLSDVHMVERGNTRASVHKKGAEGCPDPFLDVPGQEKLFPVREETTKVQIIKYPPCLKNKTVANDSIQSTC